MRYRKIYFWVAAPAILTVIVAVHLYAQQQLKQTTFIKASNTHAGDHFGCGGVLDGHSGNSVAVSADGNTMAVGAPHESSGAKGINGNQNDTSAYDAGAVYVFTRTGGGWSQQAYVKASNTRGGAEFGHSVALSADGNTMAVAAYFESSGAKGVNGNQADESIPQAGAVYVFTRRGTTWSQQAYIKASNTGEAGVGDQFGEGDQFGFSLALSGDGNTLVAGATGEDSKAAGINGDQADNSMDGSGAVYVFTRTGTTWSQQAYIKSSMPAPNVLFGYAVALNGSGDTMIASSYDDDRGKGAMYVFTLNAGKWSQQARLQASIAERGDSFGVAISLSNDGNTLAVGSHDEDCLATGINPKGCDNDQPSDTSAGAAVVFVRSGNTWTEQALLKASNIAKGDTFGSRIAVSGDGNTVAASSPLKDTNTGTVYVFRRNAAMWTQLAYLRGTNTKAGDQFGSSLALNRDGRILAVGAYGEDSEAKGVNGNQADQSAMDSGAVYVFTGN
jgi:hypothetical protein